MMTVMTRLNSTQFNWTKHRRFSVSREVLNMLRTSRLTATVAGDFLVDLSSVEFTSPELTQLNWPAERPQLATPVELS